MSWRLRNRIMNSDDDSTLTEAGKAHKEEQKRLRKEKSDASNERKENEENLQADMVNHPPHYKVGGIETLDFIRAKLNSDGYVGYCVGNVLKYLSRAGHKDKKKVQEDLKKAEFYLKEAILIGEKSDG